MTTIYRRVLALALVMTAGLCGVPAAPSPPAPLPILGEGSQERATVSPRPGLGEGLGVRARRNPPAVSVRPEVALFPASPRQGETLFAVFRPGFAAGGVRCTWDGRGIPISEAPGTVLATIGIRITERAGVHSLKFKLLGPDGIERIVSRSVTVLRTPWPVQRLKMSRARERLYTFPGAREEDAAVTRATRTSTGELLWRGPFVVPTKGRMSTRFGVKRIRNNRTTYYHRGVDLAAPTGTPVVAANAGQVVLARRFKKYGNTVVLDHGAGVTTLYIHMSARTVREGERVEKGQLIGNVGMEGVATGPHLHWSLYVHGNSVSPLFWTRLPETLTGTLARG